jgi:hypothetical protein
MTSLRAIFDSLKVLGLVLSESSSLVAT